MTDALFVEIIGAIYQAAHDQTVWPDVVEKLRTLLQGSRACLVRIGPDRRPGDLIAPSNDPAFQDRYMAEFLDEPNIIEDTLLRAPVGLVYHDLDRIGRETLRDSRLWNEWMAPQDMYGGLTVKLYEFGSSAWFFDVQRGRDQPPFTSSDVGLLESVTPHLRRALELSRSIGLSKLSWATLQHLPIGLMVVDSAQHVAALNAPAERILAAAGAALSVRRGILAAASPQKNAQLQRFLADACAASHSADHAAGGDIMFGELDGDGAPLLALSICPARVGDIPTLAPCAIVILRKIAPETPAGFVDELRRLFDLTPKEADIAAVLSSGRSLKDVAAGSGIKFSTARSHLERIFRKTGTKQQSQLVAVLKDVQLILQRE
ncbi:helix-turn-helix transcriptional regulator [Bradyrhizobium sp. HKCCYLR20261]|uniref:helix-turn-helix transcriptional regulator n=1 Tax=unclassified Bradyrhizobium TaxID=2631580 RepID=UPI003EB6FCA6